MSQPSPFDYIAYIDSIMNGIELQPDTSEATKSHIRDLIQDLVDDRIMQVILNAFSEAEFDVMDEMMKKHPEITEIDAVLAISEHIPGLQEHLEAECEAMRKEFTHYGSLYEAIKQ